MSASGSRACASKPGGDDHQLGIERPRHGQEQIVEHDAVVRVALARRAAAVHGRAAARADADLVGRARARIERDTGARTCTSRRRRAAKMSCVPLPWWTSQSTISTRAAPARRAASAAIAALLSRQNPIARSGTAWCPGGRTSANAFARAPAHRRQRRLDRGARRQPRGVPASRRHHGVGIQLAAPPGQRCQRLAVVRGVDGLDLGIGREPRRLDGHARDRAARQSRSARRRGAPATPGARGPGRVPGSACR